MAPAPASNGSEMPRVATFSRPLNQAGDGSDGQGNTPGSKPAAGGEGSFTSSMEGTFHTQARAARAASASHGPMPHGTASRPPAAGGRRAVCGGDARRLAL